MTEIKARPTLYRGTRMRSRLEADFARYLDTLGEPWAYEPDCFASGFGQWLPDFRTAAPTEDGGRRTAYVELKPAAFLAPRRGEDDDAAAGRINAVLRRMSVTWASEPGAALLLAFWSFGAAGTDYAILGLTGQPWHAWDNSELVTVWPGSDALTGAAHAR